MSMITDTTRQYSVHGEIFQFFTIPCDVLIFILKMKRTSQRLRCHMNIKATADRFKRDDISHYW
jgi:hypothetical protein